MKKRNRLAAFAAACVVAASAVVPFFPAEAAGTVPFSQNAHEIVDDIVFGWNLGNTFDAYSAQGAGDRATSETLWGNPKVTPELFQTIAESSDINAIRFPITWFNHVDETGAIDPLWLDRIEEVVTYILDQDMYCIINMHHDTGEKGWLRASAENYEQERTLFLKIWEQIAERFRDYGDKLLFEGYNELLNDKNSWSGTTKEDMQAANDLNQDFVNVIRKSGGNNAKRCLVVSTYAARYELVCTQHFVMPEDTIEDRIIVDAHAYVPYDFTMKPDVEWWSDINIDYSMGYLKERFVDNDIPLIIGEFGAMKKEHDKERIQWANYYMKHTADLGIPCFWWDSGKNDYGMLDRYSLTWTCPNLLNTLTEAAQGRVYEVPISKLTGDANLDDVFSLQDLVLLQKNLVGLETLDEDQTSNADLDKDGAITVFDLLGMKRMLRTMLNEPKNMVTDPSEWYLYLGDAVGELTVVKPDAIDVLTEQTGSFNYYMQAIYQNLSLEAGKTYCLTYTVSSEEEGLVQACIQEDDGDYETFVNKLVFTKTTPTTYTLEYTPEEDCAKARINFNCGYLEGMYHITDISFQEQK